MDELGEFTRDVLEALRQPLEDGSVTIARAGRAGIMTPRPGWRVTETDYGRPSRRHRYEHGPMALCGFYPAGRVLTSWTPDLHPRKCEKCEAAQQL